MAESVSAASQWRFDYIDHYRLDKDIIDKFLKEVLGNYEFSVKVRFSLLSAIECEMTHCSAEAMSIVFGYPEALTK